MAKMRAIFEVDASEQSSSADGNKVNPEGLSETGKELKDQSESKDITEE